MSIRNTAQSTFLTCLVWLLFWSAAVSADEQQNSKQATDLQQRLTTALDERGNWELVETPLVDVASLISDRTGIDVLISRRSLDDYGIPVDTPVTILVEGVRTRSFLNQMLRPLGLTWEVRHGAIWITNLEEAETQLSLRVYPVSELVRVQGGFGRDFDTLIRAITSNVEPDSWDAVGGPGAIEGIHEALVVSQTRDVHHQIERLLQSAQSMLERYDDDPEKIGPPLFADEAENGRIRRVLQKPISLDLVEVPLEDLADFVAEMCEIPVLVDTQALEDCGIDADVTTSVRAKDLPLRDVLRRAFHELDLAWVVRDEVLLITTEEECELHLPIVLYPVADLVGLPGAHPSTYDFDSLIETITTCVATDTWDIVGGPSTVTALIRPPALVVSQMDEVHVQVHDLLRQLREARKSQLAALPAGGVLDGSGEEAAERHQLVIYRLASGEDGEPLTPVDQVLRLVVRVIGADTFSGEDVLIEQLGNSIVIRHNERVHRSVNALLLKMGVQQFGGGLGGTVGGGGFGGGGLGGGGGGGFFAPKPSR